jgi:hypothetical protein
MSRPKTIATSAALTGALLFGTAAVPAIAAETDRTRGGVEYIWATKKNADELHVRAKKPLSTDGSCPEDFSLARAKGTHKVSWKWPKGREGIKKIKKKKWVCIYTAEDGTQTEGAISDSGRLEELPKGFPAYGKADANDVKKLNLGNDVRIEEWNPDGSQNMAATRLISAVNKTDWSNEPLVAKAELPDDLSFKSLRGVVTSGGRDYVISEYEFTGGRGFYADPFLYDPSTGEVHKGVVKLNPNGKSALYIATSVIEIQNRESTGIIFGNGNQPTGIIRADRGQGDLGSPELEYYATRRMVLDETPVNNANGQGYAGPQFNHLAKNFAPGVVSHPKSEQAARDAPLRGRWTAEGRSQYWGTPEYPGHKPTKDLYAGPPPGYTPPGS